MDTDHTRKVTGTFVSLLLVAGKANTCPLKQFSWSKKAANHDGASTSLNIIGFTVDDNDKSVEFQLWKQFVPLSS